VRRNATRRHGGRHMDQTRDESRQSILNWAASWHSPVPHPRFLYPGVPPFRGGLMDHDGRLMETRRCVMRASLRAVMRVEAACPVGWCISSSRRRETDTRVLPITDTTQMPTSRCGLLPLEFRLILNHFGPLRSQKSIAH
jgi:hypothetical protein